MKARNGEIGLPLIALGLDLAPVFIITFGSLTGRVPPFALLFTVLLPIAGLIMGIVSLSLGKSRIGKIGKTLAIITVSLPLAFVTFIVLFFIGAATGVISLM